MPPPATQRSFQTTRWSLVQRAADNNDPEAMRALTTFCEAYWYPIYAFIRRSGRAPHDAEDLTQGFFAWFLQKGALSKADVRKGRLRTFLLTCVTNFLRNEHNRALAQKRGATILRSFGSRLAEERYAAEPVDDLSPDRLYQRRWALEILDQALVHLGNEFAAKGKADLFAALCPHLGFGLTSEVCYEALATELGMPLGTIKNYVFRMRQRWRELLFEEVAQTLGDATPEDIKGELSELLCCV